MIFHKKSNMINLGSKKQIQEDNPDSSSKKNFKTVWYLKPMAAGGVNTDNLAEFPHFVLNAVKVHLSKKDHLFTYIPII